MSLTASRISDLLPEQLLDPATGTTRQGFFDYQWAGIDRIVADERIVLADQPGLGKTFQILGAMERKGLFLMPGAVSLILAPKMVAQIAWRGEIENFVRPAYPDLNIVYVFDGPGPKKREKVAAALQVDAFGFRHPALIIANHQAIEFKPGKPIRVPELLAPIYDAIAIDEAHLVLPTREFATSAARTQFWFGLAALREKPGQMRIAASGTLDRGKMENRLGAWRFLWPSEVRFADFWRWARATFRVYRQQVARNRFVEKIEQKPLSLPAWLEMERKHVIRRTKAEVAPQLPSKQYRNIELELSPRMLKAYKDYETSLEVEAARLESIGKEASASAIAMKFYTRSRQMATCEWDYTTTVVNGSREEHGVPLLAIEGDSAKLDWIVQFLEERQEEGQKVVIASDFTQVLEWLAVSLAQRLPWLQLAVLTGDTPDRNRFTIQQDFQHGSLQVVLLSQRVGTGVTLDAADDLILVDLPKDPDQIEQVEDRIHRVSRNHQVTIWRLIAVRTLDVEIAKANDVTYRKLRELSDGFRGVPFQRTMLNKITAKGGKAA